MARPVCIYARPNFVGRYNRWPRRIKKYKAWVVNRVLYPAIGLIVWTVFSFALIEIAIEDFGNEESYPTLGGYLVVIIAGFVGLLYALGVRKKKTEGEEA